MSHNYLNNLADNALSLAKELFPINRSISNDGVEVTLKHLAKGNPNFKIKNFKSKKKVFDWKVPLRWNVKKASIKRLSGEKIIDLDDNNLHVVSHSQNIKKKVSRKVLLEHIHTLSEKPNSIPYVTSYYKKSWGFCLTENQKRELNDPHYFVEIDSTFDNRSMKYGEVFIPGRQKNREIFFSTYVCHPSMANNELSGPVVAHGLINYLMQRENNFSYRFVFIPETIGSISYISSNLESMKRKIISGLVLSCVGDEKAFSIISSRTPNNPIEPILKNNILKLIKKYKSELTIYSYLERGSDERQYCSPGVDLPISGFCRSKYGKFPEYHTSDDNFMVVTKKGLKGSFEALINTLNEFDKKDFPEASFLCEPSMGKRGLYPKLGARKKSSFVKNCMNVLAYSDGRTSVSEISEIIKCSEREVKEILVLLRSKGVIRKIETLG